MYGEQDNRGNTKCILVDPRGLEPLTFSMSMKRSSQLSYGSVTEYYYTSFSSA